MGGLAILVIFGIYAGLAFKVIGSTRSSKGKLLAFGIFVLIPTADAVLGRIYLGRLCVSDGGLQVNRVESGVDGFMVDSGVSDYWVKTQGFQFVESGPTGGTVNRFTRQDDKIVYEERVAPKSLYRFRLAGDKEGLYWKQQWRVEVISTGEALATDTNIGFVGGWAEQLLARFTGAGAGVVTWCETGSVSTNNYAKVVLSSLKPRSR